MSKPAAAITSYLLGKDQNRPHRLDAAFAPDARLEMDVRTSAIDFPPLTVGRAAIANVLVSAFNQRNENVYTFCIGGPPPDGASSWSCDWLVVMSEKGTGIVRVGCGRYDWRFAPDDGLARSLQITIEQMLLLPPDELAAVVGWAVELPYPWVPVDPLLRRAPALPALEPVLRRLAGGP